MNRLSALLAIVFLSSCVTGFRIRTNENIDEDTGYIKLNPICDESRFMYNYMMVTSYYQEKFNISLGSVSQYAVDPEIDFTEFFDSEEVGEKVNKIRDSYNRIILSFFKNQYHTIAQLKDLESFIGKFQDIKKNMADYLSKVKEDKKQEFNELLPSFDKGADLIKVLMIYNDKPIHPTTMNKTEFAEYIQYLNTDPKWHIFAFLSDPFFKMLKRNLVKIDNFYLENSSGNFFNYESNVTLEYSINLPFLDKKEAERFPCTRGDELPQFFADQVGH